jgi:hypothetical protein
MSLEIEINIYIQVQAHKELGLIVPQFAYLDSKALKARERNLENPISA